MRFITIAKHYIGVFILKLLRVDIDAECARIRQEKADRFMADIKNIVEVTGSLDVFDAQGNLK